MQPARFIVSPDDYPRALNVLGVQITVLAANTATGSHEVTLQEGRFSGAGRAATKMFTQVAQEVPPGPPDVPKLVGILQNHGVTVAAV